MGQILDQIIAVFQSHRESNQPGELPAACVALSPMEPDHMAYRLETLATRTRRGPGAAPNVAPLLHRTSTFRAVADAAFLEMASRPLGGNSNLAPLLLAWRWTPSRANA